MDLGLGHLTQLKRFLLNEGLRSASTYDQTLAAIGRGVAARLEKHCDRTFGRVVGEIYETNANRSHLIVPRYPIEAVTKLEIRDDLSLGYVDQGTVNNLIYNLRETAGIVEFLLPLGTRFSRLRLTYTGGYWYPTAEARAILSGSAVLASGASSAFVTFGTAFPTVPAVGVVLQVPDGGALIDVTPQAITAEGFTVALAAPVPASGYVVSWVAAEAADDVDSSVLQSGSVTLATSAESRAVAFPAQFAAAPNVFCTIVGPNGAPIITAQPGAVTVAGFTASIGFPIPGAGYTLSWFALAAAATTSAPTLPAGATALPQDLSLAWLLQCQVVWSAIDALGTGLGDDKARAAAVSSLSSLKLSPEVEAMLDPYIRRDL